MASFKRSYLAFAILALLHQQERYGYELIQIIEGRIKGPQVKQGVLYPLRKSLEQRGLIEHTWRSGDNTPDRKYWSLTQQGTVFLAQERRAIRDFVAFLTPFLGEEKESH